MFNLSAIYATIMPNNACCKVGRVLNEYSLADAESEGAFNEEVLARWCGRRDFPETGVRPLADWFNKRVMKTVYRSNGRKTLDAHVDADYNALSSEDPLSRGSIVDDLNADGIDASALESAFVSAPTMYRHLTECLKGSKQTTPSNGDWARRKVDYAQSLASEEIEQALTHFGRTGRVPKAECADLDIAIRLSCPECGTSVRIERALNRGYVCEDHLGVAEFT